MGSRAELVIVAVLLLLVVGLFVVQLRVDEPIAQTDTYTVGVLPFITFSDNISEQQFADGLTEELLNVLSRVKSLRVAARTSSFAYRGVNKNVTEIGKELNVAIILEGSVRRIDINDTIRVTAQLIDTVTGTHLWSKTYDREFTDIFKIQDDIAASVVDELQITLLGDEREKIQSRSSANPEAMVAYGIGQAELSRRNELGFRDAERFFKKAIELDPNYVDAYTGLATAYALMVNYKYESADEYLALASTVIEQAFSREPESGAAWATRGLIYMQQMRKDDARAALEKAMAYNPSHAIAYMWYAGLQPSYDERLTWYQKAYELDPKSPVIGNNVASILMEQGRDAEAMQVFVKIIESDPHYHGAYNLAGRINEKRGRLDEAINQFERAYELSPDVRIAQKITRLYIDLGDFDSVQKWLSTIPEIPGGYSARTEWLQIEALVSTDRTTEANTILQRKLDRARTDPGDMSYEDAAFAAYYLGDHESVVWAYEQLPASTGTDEMGNRLDAAIAAAYTYDLLGQPRKSDAAILLATELLGETMSNSDFDVWYNRALLAAIQGNRQMTLIHLQRAIDEGWRQHWRPEIEPILKDLGQDKSFQSMMAGLQTRMDIMREQLALASAFDSDWSG